MSNHPRRGGTGYRLRPATAEDFEFVFRLNEANFRPYVERVRGWDEESERRAMRELFRSGVDEIVVVEGRDAGVLGVDRSEGEIYLRHIELLPEVQGRGIGGAMIRDLLQEARSKGLPVRLRVTKENEAARRLYERFGFRIIGEAGAKYLMEARPG